MTRFFEKVPLSPPDPILGLNSAFRIDPRPNKVNLGVGVYRDKELKPYLLPSVKKAERLLLDGEENKDYLPIDGDPLFTAVTRELVLGKEFPEERVAVVQAIGGTGALRLGAIFLKEVVGTLLFIPTPTWDNHHRLFTHAGFEVENYPYYDAHEGTIAFEQMIAFVRDSIPSRSAILLHGVCHNPTGCDLTFEQWQQLALLFQQKELFPLIDLAYQGFGDSLTQDVQPLRFLANTLPEMMITSSYSKNCGLYNERVGALLLLCRNGQEKERVTSKVKTIIRGLYSNPPAHGAKVVATILHDPLLRKEWEIEVEQMRKRIQSMRYTLVATLENFGPEKKERYERLLRQKGMFSYLGLNLKACERLLSEYAIYVPKDGRINIAVLSEKNMAYVAAALHAVT